MLNKLKKQAAEGFTIIEVMIVLAIAGLILVVVLVAVPQLQRNQRDTSRENVLARLSTELGSYASNNDGVYPFQTTGTANLLSDFVTRYITGSVDLKNPQTGNQYSLAIAAAIGTNPTADQILIYPGASCSGETATGTLTATSRQYAARVLLEKANVFYCVDNN